MGSVGIRKRDGCIPNRPLSVVQMLWPRKDAQKASVSSGRAQAPIIGQGIKHMLTHCLASNVDFPPLEP